MLEFIFSLIVIVGLYVGGTGILKRCDDEYVNKKIIHVVFIMTMVIVSLATCNMNFKMLVFLDIAIGCCYINCYTDITIMYVYDVVNIVMFVSGMAGVLMNGDLKGLLSQSIISACIIVIGYLVHAINVGDVGMILALLPHIYNVANDRGCSHIILSYLFILLSLLIGILLNVPKFIKEKKQKAPFGLPVLITFCGMIFMVNYINIT